jgi:TPR repeat protein
MFLRGLGVKMSVGKADGLFVKGSRLGDSWSQLSLGEMFQSGNFMIAPRASKKSATPLPVANSLAPGALPGTKPVSASPIAAQKPNLVKARKMFALAAAKGNRVAAFKLGEIFENGSGTSVDYAQAINFYSQSAAKHYAPAQLALGRITEMGLGTPVNLTYAYLWYNLAAEQDNAVAAERLQSLSKKMVPDQLTQAQALMQQLDQRQRAN